MKSVSTNSLELLKKGELLPHLQQSICQAAKSIFIVGPWIDAYFVGKIIDSIEDENINLSFMVRMEEDNSIDSRTLSALNLARKNSVNFQAKTLQNLHFKIILIDNDIFYMGSTNWYYYSLHKSLELTLTGKTSIIPKINSEMEYYWENGTLLTDDDLKGHNDTEPIQKDIWTVKKKPFKC
ncbi:MAG: hypothetical protein HVN35_07555 [Methanobacteriaceae archaeon]|nr:hypothetical protein [Methanobacteriaceae archaeon]